MCCYLTQLSYPGDGGLACVLSIHGILFKKEEDLVVLWVVTLWDQVDTDEPGVWGGESNYRAGTRLYRAHTLAHTCLSRTHVRFFFVLTILPLPLQQSSHPYFTPLKPIPRDILQSRLSNNSHSLYTPLLQYLTSPQASAPSPNPT